jgi:hypothetical protein
LQDVQSFTGSNESFEATEVSISDLGGLATVRPAFAVFSDEQVTADGVYVDDLRVLCRAATYVDSRTAAGNYFFLQGTSMATPHVSGVVALVRAAAEAADVDAGSEAVVAAILDTVEPLPALEEETVTGGLVDAASAIEAIAPAPDPGPDPDPDPDPDPGPGPGPGSEPDPGPGPDPDPGPGPRPELEQEPQENPVPGADPSPGVSQVPAAFEQPTAGAIVAPPVRIDLRNAARARWIGPRGRFAYVFRATPGTRGRAILRTRGRVRLPGARPRRQRVRIARPRFVVPASGRVVLRIDLTRRQRAILRLNRRLVLTVSVAVRDATGGRASTVRRLALRAHHSL